MAQLQDPLELPQFVIATGGVVPRDADGFPCETFDFQVDRAKWTQDIPRSNQRTIKGILGHRTREWKHDCFQCEQGSSTCPGGACVRAFHRERLRGDYQQQFQIRPTTNNTMGLGVFAGVDLVEGQLLDEYFGELIPPRTAAARTDDDYLFEIPNVASSSARDYGNWTRFVNHACRDFNLEARDDVLGGRQTITFRAIKDIDRGGELFIDYGLAYFGDGDGYILCKCPALPQPHIPPGQEDRNPQTQQAFPGPPAQQPNVPKPADVSVPEQNKWIEQKKAWLDKREPNGYSRWTMVHWRFLEQLIRRRNEGSERDEWKNKAEFTNLPPSQGDPLVKQFVSTERSQMTIQAWHLDVAKAFQRDRVCGTRQGTPWETKDLLKRIFAVNIANRRRKRKSKKAERLANKSPSIQGPATPKISGTTPGYLPTPPSSQRPQRTNPGDFPDLPSDIAPPPTGVPIPSATARQARRASARRRRQRRSYSP